MRLFLISGDGNGAGKSTLAARLVGEVNVVSFARAIRHEAEVRYPGYNWFSKDCAYKNETVVRAVGKTVRDVLIEMGETACQKDPLHWARKLVDHVKRVESSILPPHTLAVDDLRKTCELEYVRSHYPSLTHFHILNPAATYEPQYQNDELCDRSDYLLTWGND